MTAELRETPGGLWLVVDDEPKVARFECELEWCDSPFCHCSDVTLALTPDPELEIEGQPTIRIRLDPFARDVAARDEGEPDDPAAELARYVADELSDEGWKALLDTFMATKNDAMETLDPAEATFHFDFEAVELGGLEVSYGRVFPFAEPIRVAHHGKELLALDSYCVATHCDCQRASVELFGVEETRDPDAAPELGFGVDLETATWYRLGSNDRLNARGRARRRQILDHNPHLHDQLRKRRQLLRRLYESSRTKRLGALAKPAPARRPAAKAGRNAPCPCGSGKKYKRCCGR